MTEKTVFISYRRTTQYSALAVYKALREHGYDVFFDYESLETGSFEQVILRQIAARAHFVLILASGTLDRCTDPNDMVRREIEEAIRLKRNIIPLMFDGFDIGKIPAKLLPGTMVVLPSYNGLTVPKELMYFDFSMQLLRDRYLSKSLDGVIHPTPSQDVSPVQHKIALAESESKPTEQQLNAEEYNRRGVERSRSGDYDGAIADYTEAIRLNPNETVHYANRAITLNRKKDYEGAIADANEAIHLDPKYARSYVERGVARNSKGDTDGAIADYTEAIRLDPKYVFAYVERGFARNSKGDADGAIADYTEAIRLNPQDALAYNNRGAARNSKGDYDGAIADYTEAIHLDPKYALAYRNRGATYAWKDNYGASNADYQRYIDLGGADAEKARGWIRENEEWLRKQK